MRASQWLLGFATAGAVVGMIASGCGGSSSNNGPTDSGSDVSVDQGAPETGQPEAAAETGPTETGPMACAVDASLATLMLPDASIGDSGATTGSCEACINSTCGADVTACDNDCACKTTIVAFLQCVASGQTTNTCIGMLAAGLGNQATQALGTCVYTGCQHQCGLPGVPVPTEGGAGDSGSQDAKAD